MTHPRDRGASRMLGIENLILLGKLLLELMIVPFDLPPTLGLPYFRISFFLYFLVYIL